MHYYLCTTSLLGAGKSYDAHSVYEALKDDLPIFEKWMDLFNDSRPNDLPEIEDLIALKRLPHFPISSFQEHFFYRVSVPEKSIAFALDSERYVDSWIAAIGDDKDSESVVNIMKGFWKESRTSDEIGIVMMTNKVYIEKQLFAHDLKAEMNTIRHAR